MGIIIGFHDFLVEFDQLYSVEVVNSGTMDVMVVLVPNDEAEAPPESML